MGKRKKFEKVWASNTSLTDTAIKSPRNAETMAISMTAGNTITHETVDKSLRNIARTRGTSALTEPKKMAPAVLDSIRKFNEIGASRSLSNERFFFSNVTVTASIEVVPNSTEIAITPGSRSAMLSKPVHYTHL
jgi:hypothetical protein